MQNKTYRLIRNLLYMCIVLAVVSTALAVTSITMTMRHKDYGTMIVNMSEICHAKPASTQCQSLIKQIQTSGQWQVYSSDSIYWAEYQS